MRALMLTFCLAAASRLAAAAPVALAGSAGDGAAPENLLPLVGTWTVQHEGAAAVVTNDGRKWRPGSAAPQLEASAAASFPQEGARFREAVKQHASFPLAVIKSVPAFESGTVTVRFRPLAGAEDQAAGIAFALQPNGDYLILRANGLEDNLILFQFKNGRRSPLKEVRAPAPATRQWHELKLQVQSGVVRGSVDGTQYLEFALKQPSAGRIGLWSKADSVVQFRDLDVQLQ